MGGGSFLQEQTKRELVSWIRAIAFALFIAFICRHFFLSPSTVYGESMLPTFEEKDRVLISKISDIQRFDMVVFDAPDSDEQYIKRVIGLPGDTLEMKDDILYINGKEMDEPYLDAIKGDLIFNKLTGDFTLSEITGETTVPEDSIFVMGDNRLYSKDSRFFGFVSDDAIIGEVKFRLYPFNKIGLPK
jgi:signal peptidase I